MTPRLRPTLPGPALLGPALLCLAITTLGACKAEKTAKKPAGDAEGQILDRAVGDDMLPYGTLRSQPPLADKPGEEDGKKDGDDRKDGPDRKPGD